MHACMFECMYSYVCMYVCVCGVCVCVGCVCVYVCMHPSMHACMYVSVCKCVHVIKVYDHWSSAHSGFEEHIAKTCGNRSRHSITC